MEGCLRKVDLVPHEIEWLVRREEGRRSFGDSEEKQLELRLGPPVDDWSVKEKNRKRDESLLSLGCFSSMASDQTHKNSNNNSSSSGAKRGFLDTVETKEGEGNWFAIINGNQNQKLSSSSASPWCQNEQQQQPKHSFFQFPLKNPQSLSVMTKESSQSCSPKVVVELQNQEKKVCSPAATANTAVPNSSQKRIAAPVVGWPPIQSHRRNLANSSSSKPAPDARNEIPKEEISGNPESCRKGLFVKINMDGIPIGRKVDLTAYDSYKKLSTAVDELFRGLLAVQGDSFASGNQNKTGEVNTITGLLDRSGEYTLVYEDNEGDRMLVGDVPWHMFVSTVRRLRVLKSSELSTLHLGSCKQEKSPLESALK